MFSLRFGHLFPSPRRKNPPPKNKPTRTTNGGFSRHGQGEGGCERRGQGRSQLGTKVAWRIIPMTLVQWLINYAHGFSRWNVPIQDGVKLFPDPEPLQMIFRFHWWWGEKPSGEACLSSETNKVATDGTGGGLIQCLKPCNFLPFFMKAEGNPKKKPFIYLLLVLQCFFWRHYP